MADILLREQDLRFASTMVHTLNTILLTSAELFQLRGQLKDLQSPVWPQEPQGRIECGSFWGQGGSAQAPHTPPDPWLSSGDDVVRRQESAPSALHPTLLSPSYTLWPARHPVRIGVLECPGESSKGTAQGWGSWAGLWDNLKQSRSSGPVSQVCLGQVM